MMKRLFTLIVLLLLIIAPSRAADEPLEDVAEARLGFAAEPSPDNIAWLVLAAGAPPA